MNIKHISLALAVAAAALLTGCAKNPIEEIKPSEQLADLELSYVGATETKAAIDGTTFPTDGEIGLFFFKDELADTPYGESGYTNVKYAYNSSKSKWTASPSIKVGSDAGYLYGYYPYDSEVTSIKAIPVASSLNGDDVMYATPVTDVTDANAAQTSITMNHALARVSITVKNNGYTGNAELTTIKFGGAEVAPTGTLNALDGSITATESDVTLDVTGDAQAITAAGTTYECLLVPSAEISNKQTVKLTLTIDGDDKTAQLSGGNGVIIAQNTKSNITINLSNSGISVQTVSVEDWNVVEVGGHKVRVELANDTPANDVLFSVYADGNTAKIEALSKSDKSLGCIIDGKAVDKTKNTDNIYTFTVSDFTSDIIAIIGYQHVTGISLENSQISLYPNEYNTLMETVEPEDAINKNVSWSSSKESVAEVDENGKITAKSAGNAVITATTEDGGYTATCSVSVMSYPDGTVPGIFSVGPDKRVFFSNGNLVATIDASGTPSAWNFAAHQYDRLGSGGANETIGSAAGEVDLYFWSTTDDGTATTNNYGIMNIQQKYDYHGNFYDWGKVIGDGDTWRTLSADEWVYLLNTRTVGGGEKDGKSYQRATINSDNVGVYGLILYPDYYSSQTAATSYTSAEWTTMEKAGCVFLPVTGYRSQSVFSENTSGHYYSSTSGGYDDKLKRYKAICITFNDTYAPGIEDRNDRGMGCAVRLVTDN